MISDRYNSDGEFDDYENDRIMDSVESVAAKYLDDANLSVYSEYYQVV